jgi:hypothetical protein
VRVHFPGQEIRIFKTDQCALVRVEENEETAALAARLTPAARTAAVRFRPLNEYVELFTRRFPGGFDGTDYAQVERDPKLKARELLQRSLGRETLAGLIAGGQFGEIVERAFALIGATTLVDRFEGIALRKGLKEDAALKPFAEALNEVLYGTGARQARFEQFVRCLEGLHSAKWPVATYFQYLADPEQEMFLKPNPTKAFAAACETELNYAAHPNWKTYESLLALSVKLRDALAQAGLRPRDMIDVQSFMTTAYKLSMGTYGKAKAAKPVEKTAA